MPSPFKELNLRARISSFNDELRDTNKLVEMAHVERDNLKLEINDYSNRVERLQSEELDIKNKIKGLKWSLQEETTRYDDVLKGHAEEEAVLKSLNNDIAIAVGELNKLNNLKPKVLLLNKQIKSAEQIISALNITKAKVEGLVNKENTKLRKIELNQEEVIRDTEIIRRKLKEEEKVFFQRVKKLELAEQKHTEELQRFSLEQEKKDHDIRIVKARLKKKWSELFKDRPFPKL